MRFLVGVVAFVTVSAVATAALADVTAQDVEDARRKLQAVSAELQDEVAAYDAAVTEQARLEARLDRLVLDLSARERDLNLARRQARDRVADMYMNAGQTDTVLSDDDLGSAPTRIVYLQSVRETDTDVVNRLEVARREYEQLNELVQEALAQQEDLVVQQEAAVEVIYQRLDAANEEYQAIKQQWDKQEEERRLREWLATSTTTTTTTAPNPGGPPPTSAPPPTAPPPPPPPPGTRVCPVDGAVTFRDSWGEFRPPDRGHTGVDMMASTGTPLVAIETGTIWSPNFHWAGGYGLYLIGNSGDKWYYAHMNGYASGIRDGTRVVAGQLVGFVGSSGNASTPHLHLGWQPGGGSYANPYPVVAALC
jgi:murein DD-endopeptidase MepM/ murein hydrolase activator NlpD